MGISRVKSVLVSASISIAAALGCVGSSQAAVYSGSWDPVFGPAFPNLGWKGDATFFVPDACLAGSGWTSNFSACAGGAMKVISAEVQFYNLSAPSVIVETLNFDPQSMFELFTLSMDIENHQLAGVSSGPSAPVRAYSSIAGGGQTFFDLLFLGGNGGPSGAKLLYATCGSESSERSLDKDDCTFGSSFNPSPESGGTITYAPIPEPETYALMLAGLAAMGFVVRRRRK